MSKSTRPNSRKKLNNSGDDGTYASHYPTTRAAKKERLLQAHHWGATVTEAARWAGVSVATLYRWRDNDPEFSKAWLDARLTLVDGLEREAFRRASQGSDRMLSFLLRYLRPEIYNQRQSQLTQSGKSTEGMSLETIEAIVSKW